MDIIIKAASSGNSPFDSIRQIENGIEFWFARELMPVLGYQKWERFGAKKSNQVSVVSRAIISCSNSGGVVADNFTHFPKQGTGFSAIPEDWKLSRHACYLVAMNGDVTKPEIAAAQSYFAAKTRQAEIDRPVEIATNSKAKTLDELSIHDLRCLLVHRSTAHSVPFETDLTILAGIDPIFWLTPQWCLEYLLARLQNKTDSILTKYDLGQAVWDITSDSSKSSKWDVDILKAKTELADRLQRQESILNSKNHQRAYQKFKAQLADFQAQGQLV